MNQVINIPKQTGTPIDFNSIQEDLAFCIESVNSENPGIETIRKLLIRVSKKIKSLISANVQDYEEEDYSAILQHELNNIIPIDLCDCLLHLTCDDDDELLRNHARKIGLEIANNENERERKTGLQNFYLDYLGDKLKVLKDRLPDLIFSVDVFDRCTDIHLFPVSIAIENYTPMQVVVEDETEGAVLGFVTSLADMGVAIREVLRNAYKAGAQNVHIHLVKLEAGSNSLEMSFYDDGIGLSPETLETLDIKYGKRIRKINSNSNAGNGGYILTSMPGIRYTITNSPVTKGALSVLEFDLVPTES